MNVVLKLSKLCNLRCTYCYEYEQLGEAARMPHAGLTFFFESLADALADTGGRGVRFALHGGEPLLLAPDYLRHVVTAQHAAFSPRGITVENALQTNLYRVPAGAVALLAELGIALGVSIDVQGAERVDAAGRDSDGRVRRNLDALLESGARERVRIGGISVLHAGNVDRAADTYRFFAARALEYRILPIFAVAEAPRRMQHLLLPASRIVAALQDVFVARLGDPAPGIGIEPLDGYLEAAVRHTHGIRGRPHDPAASEWALIVDTDGAVYPHYRAYDPGARLGNAFTEPVRAMLASAGRRALVRERVVRSEECGRCRFGAVCTRLPVIEALPSERGDGDGCPVARPMIDWLAGLAAASAAA